MGKIKDLTGQKFGRLLVLSFEGLNSNKQATWKTICDCGNEKIIPARSLSHDRVMSCGCYKSERIVEVHSYANGVSAANVLYNDYKRHAKTRNYSFELTKEEFFEFTQRPCHYCGILLWGECKTQSRTGTFRYNGVDRMDNSLGYVLYDCVACCGRCNRAKGTMNYEEFLNFIKQVYNTRVIT